MFNNYIIKRNVENSKYKDCFFMEAKKIYLACIQGFCSGVGTAVQIVEETLKKYGTPLYVYHEIVHNTFVVEGFRRKGIIFVEDISEVPRGSRIIFSAHGISPSIIEQANQRELKFIDATCPLVKKGHREAVHFSDENRYVILIGHKGHQEIIGTSGHVKSKLLRCVQTVEDVEKLQLSSDTPVSWITQTTLSVEDTALIIQKLKEMFRDIEGPAKENICYATQNRQDAVKELAEKCDVILICGSLNSSNSNRLRETGERAGVSSYIIDCADELKLEWLKNKTTIGISSGASVPEYIVNELIEKICFIFPGTTVMSVGESNEPNIFPLPEI